MPYKICAITMEDRQVSTRMLRKLKLDPALNPLEEAAERDEDLGDQCQDEDDEDSRRYFHGSAHLAVCGFTFRCSHQVAVAAAIPCTTFNTSALFFSLFQTLA